MARTALYAPAHRVMGRNPIGSRSGASQPPTVSMSFDAGGMGIQDSRWLWNAGTSANAPQVIGWPDPGLYPVIDVVPATLAPAAFAAAQVPVAGTPMNLVATSGAGVIVPTAPVQMFPGGQLVPVTGRFVQAIPVYNKFGFGKQQAYAYDSATMLERCITVTSVGNDSTATITLTGVDQYGYLMHQTMTMGNAVAVTTTKAFKALLSAVCSGTLSGSNVSIGTADVFGVPFYAAQQSQIYGYWNNLVLYGTGTFVAGVTTIPSTFLTGDTCGTWAPASASDGTKRLTMSQRPWLPQMTNPAYGLNQGLFGVTQA
jgi:hypothetical protein